jgi:hypothetical protein
MMSSLVPAAIVEVQTLLKVVLYSLALGLGVAVVFAIGVSSANGLLDALRDRRTLAGAAWGVLGVLCISGVLAAIVLGIIVMARK